MAITLLASASGANKNKTTLPTASLNTNGGTMLSSASKNNGGVIGGVGYFGEKIGLGALSGIEGIWDYTAGGIAKLFGYDKWAERQFANDWVNYSHADEWYNPSEGWKIAGDVAGGIGSSLPAIGGALLGAAITVGTAGAASPVGAALISGSISAGIAGLGAAGNATKEAYRETGKLTGKEFGYGALSGITEAGLEFATAGLAKGSGRIVNAIGKKAATKLAADTAKETAETMAKTGAKKIFKQLGEDFVTEAIEEGLSEILSPQYQKITYNPDAENATLQEIGYAAMIGGLSGMLMTGSSIGIKSAYNTTENFLSGRKSAESGSYKSIIKQGKAIADGEDINDTGIEANQSVRDTYNKLIDSLKNNNGIATTEEVLNRIESGNISFKANEQMYLGKLKKANTVAKIYPYIERSALGLMLNPEASAERYKVFGIKDADGNAINVTADDILSGIDKNLLEKFKEGTLTKKESVAFAKSYRKALSENSTLATLAVAEATGQIMVDTKRITESILNGENIANTADINRIIERGSIEEKNALSQALGVDLNTLTKTELGIKLAEYNASNGTSEWASQMKRIREAAEINENSATPIPETLRKNMNDGVYRLTNDDKSINIAIVKEGESFHLYDYDGQRISRSLTSKEVNSILKEMNQNRKAKLENQFDNTNELSAEAKQLDELLRDKIPEYKSMSEPNKEAMRMTMRQALAHGVTEDVALIATKVAQRSGLNVIFDAIQAQGDGAISGNTIYINPKLSEKRVCEVVLGHEMFHKIFAEGSKKSWKLYEKAKQLIEGGNAKQDKTVSDAAKIAIDGQVNTENLSEADAVRAKYKAFYKKNKVDSATATAIAEEEVGAAGVEKVINSKEAWDYILGEEPSFATKVLSFFGKASKEYAAFNSLSSQAKKFLREYKKLFNEISAKNQGNNALSIALEKAGVKKMPSDTAPYTRANADGEGGEKDIDEVERYAEEVDLEKRHSFSSISYSFFGDKEVGVADFENGSYKDTEGYKKYVNECLNNMKQTRDGFTEESARKEVENSIQGIVDVAVAMKKAGYDILDTNEKRETRDSKNRLLFSSLEPNSDYITSSDISTICDKRINFQEIYDDIVRRETELKVPKGKRFFDNIDNYFIIHKIMADKGLTQPCQQCYVESMRARLGPMAKAFLQLVQETNPENKSNPQLYNQSGKNKGAIKSNNAKLREKVLEAIDREEYDITVDKLDEDLLSTDEGLTTLRLQAPLIYEAFNSFYGQSKPKMPKSATPFRFGELTALLTNDKGKINKALVEKIKSTGGFRLQSYSDFQIQNFADVLQVIFEAGTLGLNGHAYTKVPAFLDATKGTNLKRNISIFMYKDGSQWKIDRNDSFPYKLDEIYDIVNADKTGNTSIIAVVQNEDMAAYVMANDNIGYFIPFHKSGLKMATVRETIVKEGGREIKGYSGIKDHTRQQTEVWAFNENGHKAYTKVDKGINIYEFWDFDNKENLSKNELIEKNLKRYIDECKKARYVPKFREYLINNEAVLNNVLKYAKELGTMPSNATIEDISFEYKGYRIPYGYYKCLGDFGMFKPNGKASPIETLSLKDYNFNEAVDFFSDAKTLRRNEILQQIANGEERERYRNSDMTTAEIAEEVQSKRNKVVEEVVSGEYKNKRYALTDDAKKITAEMSDAERAEILSKKQVLAPIYTGQADATILANKDAFEQKKMDIVKTVIATLGDEFGLVGGQISFEDVDIEVTLSKTNLRESTTKQATPAQLAKLIPVLKPAAQTAVGIERHDNRYFFDNDTVYFDNLLGGYIDGEDFVPVRFGLKHSRTGNTVLYVVVDQNKIPVSNLTEIKNDTGHQDAKSDLTEVGGPRRRVTYSIAQIIQFVNSGDVLRYLPDEMLSEEQKVSKWEAVAETKKYTAEKNDKKYFDYIKNGNLRDARRMIIAAAKAAGYTIECYHGTRQTFTAFSNELKGSNTRTETSKRMFFAADKATANSYYPYGVMQAIHEQHPEWAWADTEKVKVKGNLYHLFIRMKNPLTVDVADYDYAAHRDNADSWMEFVAQAEANHNDGIILLNAMDNQLDTSARASTVYMFAQPSQAKSAETITYDDDGNVIPLSERFNVFNPDIRYALTDSASFDTAKGSVEKLQRQSFKEKVSEGLANTKDGFIPGIIATEIQLTNAQAGIEHAGRRLGMKDVEALVQRCRASRAMAQEMLGGGQWQIFPSDTKDTVVKLGEGFEPILSEIRDKRKNETQSEADARYEDYQYYLYHKHNVDRMSLEKRSLEKNKADVKKYKELKKSVKTLVAKINENRAAKDALKGKYTKDAKAERLRLTNEIKRDLLVYNANFKAMTELKREIDAFVPEENKPVLRRQLEDGSFVPIEADESARIAEEYEKKYPEFKANSEKVYKFLNNLLDMRVNSGLLDSATAERLKKKYPHYVPTYRVEHKMGTAPVRGKGNLEVSKTIGKATGSIETLDDLELSISRMVQKVVSAANVNTLMNKLYDASLKHQNTTYLKEIARSKIDESVVDTDEANERPKNNQINIYRNGERITLAVTHEIFLGFDEFNTRDEATILPIRAVSKVTSVFKSLVTSANPIFLVRNFIRDLQDAGINTKYVKTFGKNYAKAIYHLSHNTEYAQLYRAAGGFSASIFDYVDGFVGKQSKMGFTNSTNKAKWLLNKIENANMFIEQLPRFAEFISALEAGATVDQAILDAADVTTNFGRSGKLTRKLNSTIIPFLNPAVQGLSKVYRNFKGAFKSPKAFAELLIKCLILGIIPMALNNLLYNDDEEYDDIKDTDKENNYLFKVGDTWIKIPKGRFVSVLAGATNRTAEEISGGDADWKEYFENVISQITPVENFTRPIWSPFTDVANNKTWYGGEIEGRQFENVRPGERYDESTSEIAKWIGDKINYSPKKIHYLLDQYSGVIGDFVLPATTQKAEKSFVASAFIFDPVTSNKLSNEFYELYEEATYNKTSGDITSIYQLKHLNEVKSAISDMYDEITKIQQSDLSNAEKLQQTRVIRILINNAYKTAITDYEGYTSAIESTEGLFDESEENGVKMRYTEITRRFYGAEKALEVYNSAVYEKCKLLNGAGIDYDNLYSYYFSTKGLESDKDKQGNTINGSKRKKVVSAINKLNITSQQKLLLIASSGYSLSDNEQKSLLRYILGLRNITKAQKEELAKLCGFNVKNGRIILK